MCVRVCVSKCVCMWVLYFHLFLGIVLSFFVGLLPSGKQNGDQLVLLVDVITVPQHY